MAAPQTGAPLVPTHRDLHDKQLLWDGLGLSVLDLDTVCRAEPAQRASVARLAAVYAFRPPWREAVLHWAAEEWRVTCADERSLICVSPPSPQSAGR